MPLYLCIIWIIPHASILTYHLDYPQCFYIYISSGLSTMPLFLHIKCSNNLGPKYLSDLITVNKPIQLLQSADLVFLDMPRKEQVTYGGRAFLLRITTSLE